MKTRLAWFFTLFYCLVSFASQPSLLFPEQKIGLPPLPLSENAKQDLPAFKVAPNPWTTAVSPKPLKVSADRFVITPNDNVDYKLLVKEPDPSIDYQLIVKKVEGDLKK